MKFPVVIRANLDGNWIWFVMIACIAFGTADSMFSTYMKSKYPQPKDPVIECIKRTWTQADRIECMKKGAQ